MSEVPELARLARCFEGAVPSVIATADAAGVPNVTYLSCVRMVDDERVALSNQFLSKTARNLAENPRASVLIIDPATFDEYRLTLVYERTERRGPVFDRLRADVEHAAAMHGMQEVFRLRSADVYRVERIDPLLTRTARPDAAPPVHRPAGPAERLHGLVELTARLRRCTDPDVLVEVAVRGLGELLGYHHAVLLLLDEDGRRLYTVASSGYPAEGVGSEIVVGEGVAGMAATRCTPIRVGNLRQTRKYAQRVREAFEEAGGSVPGREIPLPGLDDAESRLAVPAMALGQLVGVLMVESHRPAAFDDEDEAVLGVIATLVAAALEAGGAADGDPTAGARTSPPALAGEPPGPRTLVRFYPADGSTFVDGDYLIKGVAGRLLWALLGHHQRDGRIDFTNREVRLDPSLELPDFKDNFESRLILLKRRLDERDAPVRIERTGRGRFRLDVRSALQLECVDTR